MEEGHGALQFLETKVTRHKVRCYDLRTDNTEIGNVKVVVPERGIFSYLIILTSFPSQPKLLSRKPIDLYSFWRPEINPLF